MTKRIWGFIDGQSLPNAIYQLEEGDYERIFLFFLEKNDVPTLENHPNILEKTTLVSCKGKQKHTLNILLSFYIGQQDNKLESEIAFQIVSEDRQLHVLTEQIERECTFFAPKPIKITFESKVLKVMDILYKRKNTTLPKSKTKLINFISNSTKEPELSEKIVEHLKKHHFLKLDEDKVSYNSITQSLLLLKTIENIRSIQENKRPRKRNTLVNHIKTFFKSQEINANPEQILKGLSQNKVLSVHPQKGVTYYL